LSQPASEVAPPGAFELTLAVMNSPKCSGPAAQRSD
jgi:hypothetical protein